MPTIFSFDDGNLSFIDFNTKYGKMCCALASLTEFTYIYFIMMKKIVCLCFTKHLPMNIKNERMKRERETNREKMWQNAKIVNFFKRTLINVIKLVNENGDNRKLMIAIAIDIDVAFDVAVTVDVPFLRSLLRPNRWHLLKFYDKIQKSHTHTYATTGAASNKMVQNKQIRQQRKM